MPAFTPVNLLTGFLGSGKTTLLRRLLANPVWSGTAVLINEFGEIGLDHHLLERIDETMVLLQSGCLCCTVRGELAQAMRDLHSRRERGTVPVFRRIVVESTGLADPFPILSTLKGDRVLRHHFRAGNVITTVDAINGLSQLEAYIESKRQVAAADRLVLTKTDIADGVQAARLVERIRLINPDAPVVTATDASIDEGALPDQLDASAFSHSAPRWPKAQFRSEETTGRGALRLDDRSHKATDRMQRSSGIHSFVVIVSQPIDWTAFGIWLSMLLNRHGDKVLRVKGILNIAGEEAPVAIHGVRYLVHPPTHMAAWPDEDRRSRIVFIVDGLDPDLLRRSLAAFNGIGVASKNGV